MGYVVRTAQPSAEPVALADLKNYLRLDSGFTGDDTFLSTVLIPAARQHAERITGKALARGTFRQVLDSMPYYTDTIQSQLAYPPSYYALPRYSTTLWNYSQMIKLYYPPVISVQRIRFVNAAGNADELHQDADFVLDRESQPARIFPIPGRFWPPNAYTPNSCIIDFTAGYDANLAASPDTHTVAAPAWSNTVQYAAGDIAVYTGNAWQANEEVPVNKAPGTNDPSGNPYWSAAPADVVPPIGQQPDSIILEAMPASILRCLFMLCSFWYGNRNAPSPPQIDDMLAAEACIDFQPTRG